MVRRENLPTLVGGIIVGVLIVLFIQFHVRLVNVNNRVATAETTLENNSAAITNIVNFINQGTQGAQEAAGQAE